MDANGARRLALVIAGHQHWRRAPAVQRGDQVPHDPDNAFLIGMAEGIRHYQVRAGSGLPMERRLVDGWWTITKWG